MSTATQSNVHRKGNGAARDDDALAQARPVFHQHAKEIQPYGTVLRYPIALDEKIRVESVGILNQVLVDTMTLRDLYKKHHWQVSGATFYQLHLLYDKHYGEQAELVDELAERIQTLGGISIAMAADVAELTLIRARRAAAKRCPCSSRGCWKRTRCCCCRSGAARRRASSSATTAPTTCS